MHTKTILLLQLLSFSLTARAFYLPLFSARVKPLCVAYSHLEVPPPIVPTRSFVRQPPSTTKNAAVSAPVPSQPHQDSNQIAWERGKEVVGLVFGQVVLPLATSFLAGDMANETAFWEKQRNGKSNADRVVQTIEELGCTYVKFAQALASRPDLVPAPLAKALAKLQDNMEPFSTSIARDIIIRELLHNPSSLLSAKDLESLLGSLSATPVAAASIGQVYKAYLPRFGSVAIKVRRPDIQETIARDAALLTSVATFIESLQLGSRQLVKTKLVDAVSEFMSRLEEELDYRNEATNIRVFGDLYSHRRAVSDNKVRVVVPQVLEQLCTDNVLVMEWIDGSKLTDVDPLDPAQIKENLALIQQGIECTLSQLLETGILHADPHSANLVKVPCDDGKGWRLGYLDFGLLSTVPESVRDALVCSVTQLVFARDVQAVASLFGELQLLPQHVLDDSERTMALARTLDNTLQQVVVYPKQLADDIYTRIPHLQFDRLLESLAGILPEFEFQLPPYFLSNCRALAIMEGNARMLDPEFNVVKVLYPYALNRLFLNPSCSPVVDGTLWSLMADPRTGAVDPSRIAKLLGDSAALTGHSRRKVALDVLATHKGRHVARTVALELAKTRISARQRKRRIKLKSYFRL